jgi:hypothetical protein
VNGAGTGLRHTTGTDRILEVLAVMLLGLATVGSAWCGYEATRWGGEQGDLARQASDLDIESARLSGIATQRVAYDAGILADYAQAVATGQENLVEFYRSSLIRPPFLPLLADWEEQVAAGRTPDNLFEDEAYLEEQYADSQAVRAQAEATTQKSQEAGRTADDYVLTTIFFAIALFFAGVTSTFRTRSIQILLLMGASLTVAFALARLAELPVT